MNNTGVTESELKGLTKAAAKANGLRETKRVEKLQAAGVDVCVLACHECKRKICTGARALRAESSEVGGQRSEVGGQMSDGSGE